MVRRPFAARVREHHPQVEEAVTQEFADAPKREILAHVKCPRLFHPVSDILYCPGNVIIRNIQFEFRQRRFRNKMFEQFLFFDESIQVIILSRIA